MYERRHEPLLPLRKFIVRQLKHAAVALALVTISLAIGMAGYYFLDGLDWTDSFVNASMLLGGMGPVDPLKSEAAKIFAGCYALFSGLIFLVSAGVLFAPILHRLFHHFHLAPKNEI